jgi:glycerate 2-kinase
MRVVAACDKFRGTATASEAVAAVARGAADAGWECTPLPLADGGEGTLEALGGPNRTTLVSGPLGDPVDAPWRLVRGVAVIEMACASGLELVGGAEGNDPIAASTYGTGELIQAAVDGGARRIIVGLGGSATTDGGLGALRALAAPARLRGVELVVACDVRTRFLDAAERFAAQKGASPAQVRLLSARLERLVQSYREDHGVDVADLEGGGAAGGLAGGLAVVGAELVSGFDVVAEEVGLDDALEDADLVVTGEGFLDLESFEGKVVGGVIEWAAGHGVPVLVVAGEVLGEVADRLRELPGAVVAVSMVERCGPDAARGDAPGCIERVVREHLGAR